MDNVKATIGQFRPSMWQSKCEIVDNSGKCVTEQLWDIRQFTSNVLQSNCEIVNNSGQMWQSNVKYWSIQAKCVTEYCEIVDNSDLPNKKKIPLYIYHYHFNIYTSVPYHFWKVYTSTLTTYSSKYFCLLQLIKVYHYHFLKAFLLLLIKPS